VIYVYKKYLHTFMFEADWISGIKPLMSVNHYLGTLAVPDPMALYWVFIDSPLTPDDPAILLRA